MAANTVSFSSLRINNSPPVPVDEPWPPDF
jgi:hypothetical protein